MDIMCFFRKLFLDSAEPVQAYAQSLRDHNQFAIADMTLTLFDAGYDQRSHFHAQQIDFPGQILLGKGRLVNRPTDANLTAADISL